MAGSLRNNEGPVILRSPSGATKNLLPGPAPGKDFSPWIARLQALLSLLLFLLLGFAGAAPQALCASRYGLRFAGVEFYGSSQITRAEIQKYLALKPGATMEQATRAVDRLKKQLELRHVNSKVQVVSAPPDKFYVVVDVSDSAADPVPTRRLKEPRHVLVRSERPFILLDQLESRLQKLTDEGRPWSENIKDGVKYFSDEPANVIVEQLARQVPDMRLELLAVIASDPDPNRRRKAVQLLSWAGAIPETTYYLIPALDDADSDVRAEVARYMFSRFEMLPDNFPFQMLVEAVSRQLSRNSHQDRTKALYCLLALAGQKPQLVNSIKIFNEERIKQLAEASVIPSVRDPAQQLLSRFAAQPPAPARQAGGQDQPPADWGGGGGFF
ncbi:MAG TPA: hypothetical protein V6D08_04620 [Candidatus Obscuribacterales bacterium]